MTLTITLFGGAALIVVLYFALRAVGVSGYWRGVISGAVPTLAMIGYSAVRWPGGDVMALHIALYVAIAAGVTAVGGGARKSGPIHWIPALIVAAFVGLAILMAAFVTISTRGIPPELAKWVLPKASRPVYTSFSGEVPHDEAAAKTVSQYLKRTAHQRELGWQIEVAGLDALEARRSGEIVVNARDGAAKSLDGAAVRLHFSRPAAGGAEKTAQLPATGSGAYRGRVELDQPGQWIAVLVITRDGDKFETAKVITVSGM